VSAFHVHLNMIAMIGTNDLPCWLAESCQILLRLLECMCMRRGALLTLRHLWMTWAICSSHILSSTPSVASRTTSPGSSSSSYTVALSQVSLYWSGPGQASWKGMLKLCCCDCITNQDLQTCLKHSDTDAAMTDSPHSCRSHQAQGQ